MLIQYSGLPFFVYFWITSVNIYLLYRPHLLGLLLAQCRETEEKHIEQSMSENTWGSPHVGHRHIQSTDVDRMVNHLIVNIKVLVNNYEDRIRRMTAICAENFDVFHIKTITFFYKLVEEYLLYCRVWLIHRLTNFISQLKVISDKLVSPFKKADK